MFIFIPSANCFNLIYHHNSDNIDDLLSPGALKSENSIN
jgi:hypothetical protein